MPTATTARLEVGRLLPLANRQQGLMFGAGAEGELAPVVAERVHWTRAGHTVLAPRAKLTSTTGSPYWSVAGRQPVLAWAWRQRTRCASQSTRKSVTAKSGPPWPASSGRPAEKRSVPPQAGLAGQPELGIHVL